MTAEDDHHSLKIHAAEQLNRLSNKMLWGRKHPRDYGTGELLYMSEIEIINELASSPGLNLTQLSINLGVTKATLSPIVAKLERRAYLTKTPHADNKRIKTLTLTKRGRKANKGTQKLLLKFLHYMEDVTELELKSYIRLLKKMESFVDDVDSEFRR